MLISPIPTEPWRVPDRDRRRRICRRIRRTFLRTVGCVTVALVIGYAAWFRFGWTDLPVRCVDWRWEQTRPVLGDLRPHAADAFETVLTTLYGEAAVRRVSPERIQVRPVVVYFGDDKRLADLAAHLTARFSDLRVEHMSPVDVAQDCRLVQHYLLAGGRAEGCDDSFDTAMLQAIRQDALPWLTRFFHVEQPEPYDMKDLIDQTLPDFREGPHWRAKPIPLEDLRCGPTLGHKILYGGILIAGAIIMIFD